MRNYHPPVGRVWRSSICTHPWCCTERCTVCLRSTRSTNIRSECIFLLLWSGRWGLCHPGDAGIQCAAEAVQPCACRRTVVFPSFSSHPRIVRLFDVDASVSPSTPKSGSEDIVETFLLLPMMVLVEMRRCSASPAKPYHTSRMQFPCPCRIDR
jgi:hypothetical protein